MDRRDRAVRRDLLARAALAQIPKLLTLQDRNPHSPTFGCFDRNHWHYKIIDFPSGMAQEFAYPLALAYDTDLPDNPFFQKAALVDFVQAGISFAARSAHADGSCDDYFPYERAGGAAGFSLLACLESTTLLDLENSEALRFFELRATWLANHHETGTLTNHQALIALCLELAGRRLGTDRWKTATRLRIERVLEWQSSEGWYREYEGCDPGYLSLTVSLLPAWTSSIRSRSFALRSNAPSTSSRLSFTRMARLAASTRAEIRMATFRTASNSLDGGCHAHSR